MVSMAAANGRYQWCQWPLSMMSMAAANGLYQCCQWPLPMTAINDVNGRCQWPLPMVAMAATNGVNGRYQWCQWPLSMAATNDANGRCQWCQWCQWPSTINHPANSACYMTEEASCEVAGNAMIMSKSHRELTMSIGNGHIHSHWPRPWSLAMIIGVEYDHWILTIIECGHDHWIWSCQLPLAWSQVVGLTTSRWLDHKSLVWSSVRVKTTQLLRRTSYSFYTSINHVPSTPDCELVS